MFESKNYSNEVKNNVISVSQLEKDIIFRTPTKITKILQNIKIKQDNGKEIPFIEKYRKTLQEINFLETFNSSNKSNKDIISNKIDSRESAIRNLQNKISKIDTETTELEIKMHKYEEVISEKLPPGKRKEYKEMKTVYKELKENENNKKDLLNKVSEVVEEKKKLMKQKQSQIESIEQLRKRIEEMEVLERERKLKTLNHENSLLESQKSYENFNKNKIKMFQVNKNLIKSDKGKVNNLIKALNYAQFGISKMVETQFSIEDEKNMMNYLKNVSLTQKMIGRPMREICSISNIKRNYSFKIEHLKNINLMIKKTKGFAHRKLQEFLDNEDSYNRILKEHLELRSKFMNLEKKEKEKTKGLEKIKNFENEKQTEKTQFIEKKITDISKQQNEIAVELTCEREKIDKLIGDIKLMEEKSKKLLELVCKKCRTKNSFFVQLTKETDLEHYCPLCRNVNICFVDDETNNISTKKLNKTKTKIKRKKLKKKLKEKSIVKNENDVKKETKIINKTNNYTVFEAAVQTADENQEDAIIKVEGVDIYSKKYRISVLKNLEPFPEKEFKRLHRQLLEEKDTKVMRHTRSGSAYNVTKHKSTVISYTKFPKLRSLLEKLMLDPEENKVKILIYMRLFVEWLSNASGDPKPWIKPPPISPLEQFDLSDDRNVKKRKLVGYDLTSFDKADK